MSLRAPLRVPVELRLGDPARGAPRWFRLSVEVGADGLLLGGDVPDEVDGPPEVTFHLPADGRPLRCRARVSEVVVGEAEEERAARRALGFIDLDEADRARIQSYVHESLGIA